MNHVTPQGTPMEGGCGPAWIGMSCINKHHFFGHYKTTLLMFNFTGWHYLLNFSHHTTFKAELKTFLFSHNSISTPNKNYQYPVSATVSVCVFVCVFVYVCVCICCHAIPYVNCFGRPVLYMCIEYRI